MITIQRTLAQKYTLAFLNLYDSYFTEQSIENTLHLQQFLKRNKNLYVYLSFPSITASVRHDAIKKITTHFKTPFLIPLIMLLLKHKRITLLPLIIEQSIKEHQKRHQVTIFTIKTSHSLQENEKQHIINFIQNELGQKKILIHFSISPGLISGLRIKSDTMLWERSIKKTLQQIQQSLFQRVGL